MSIKELIRPSILKLEPYSSARDEFILKDNQEDLIFLDANESPFETDYNRYPDPYQRELKKIISSKLGGETDNLFLGNGSDEIIDLLFRCFCRPTEDQVVISSPTYGMYKVSAAINEVGLIDIPLTKNFELKTDEIIKTLKIKTVKMLFICSPNNPTGKSFPIDQIVEILENTDKLVIIDEAYVQFSDQASLREKINKYPNLVVLQTLSKLFGLAGLRLGLCWTSAEIIEILNKVKPPYNINSLSQKTAIEVLKDVDINQIRKQNAIEREKYIKALQSLPWVEQVYESDANFLLFRCDNADLRYQKFLEKGIVVRNRSKQLNCENCLRISLGTPEQNKKIIELLSTF
jgi:histidinol-phosphate aminotransferase